MTSLYVHVPFCDHICAYCDFCKVFYKEDWADQYIDALAYEIKEKHLTESYDTIYIGGGTPSALNVKQLERLLQLLEPLSQDVQEYSIEVNPESMSHEKLDLLVHYHINRLSIGVQTFHDELLKVIQRYHTSDQAIYWIQEAKAKGIDDINVDLIYGLPNQTLEDVFEDIEKIGQLDIAHVSIYSLILEDHTLLKQKNYQPLDDEQDAYWYQKINEGLQEQGFIHYEVSNYYKKKPSLHNLMYWHYEDYEGIGLSAHSLQKHHRIENTNSLNQYLKHQYLKEDIPLDTESELFETIMMGLRLVEGLHIPTLNARFGIDTLHKYQIVIEKYRSLKMLEIRDDYLHTTTLGMNYLNTILVDFLG